jgi:hypothetical protein
VIVSLTFVLFGSINQTLFYFMFCLKTLSIMTNFVSIWTCLGLCSTSITLFDIYYACPSKEKHVWCLCQPSLWPICQCTCLGLWPMGITLFPYLLYYDAHFCGLIPCPSGIVESRYAPNTGYEYGLCGKGDVFTNRMGESACVVAQAFQPSFCCM